MNKQVVIAGGGASGLMAAVTAAECGAAVTVLEHNEKPGKKLLASGNGKCNLTNRHIDTGAYRSDDRSKLVSVISSFTPEDTLRFFERLGLSVFDRGGWVYPRTEQSSSVLDLLMWEALRLGVKFKNKEEVVSIKSDIANNKFSVSTRTWKYSADSVIIACGSNASSVRGSSDTAIKLADELGIPRHAFVPALVPLRISGNMSGTWSGTRVHAAAALRIDGSIAASDTGEIQMTSYGLSGIPVFQLSRYAVPALQEGRKVELILDMLPDLEREQVEELWRERRESAPEKTNLQLLTGLIPDRIIPVLLDSAGLRHHEVPLLTDHVPGGPYEKLISELKGLVLNVDGTGPYEQAQICQGGIALQGLGSDLQCRRIPGLYAAGEAVNADGPCGGYNLQWAWSSGHMAGMSAAGAV